MLYGTKERKHHSATLSALIPTAIHRVAIQGTKQHMALKIYASDLTINRIIFKLKYQIKKSPE